MNGKLLVILLLAIGRTALAADLTLSGDRFLMNGEPFQPWGIRVASGVYSDDNTRQLIAQLDDYKSHGINSIAVFYQGSSGGYSNPFSADGKAIDPAVIGRMDELLKAADSRGMLVIVGIFYQRADFPFRDKAAVRQVVRTVTESLRPHRNIVLNIANEQNSGLWSRSAKVYDIRDAENIIDLCRLVNSIDPARIVGGGGYDHDKNETIGRSPEVDVLLFDTSGPKPNSDQLYERFVKAGVTGKPIVNVETFGGWTKQFLPPGVFPPEVKATYLTEVAAAKKHPGLSVFFHNNPWVQGPDQQLPTHYELGGDGTMEHPGIRWYAAAIDE